MADPNRDQFERAVRLLAPVLDDLIFVGGCATGFMFTDPAAAGIRPTHDLDAIAVVASYAAYTTLANRLRAIGLKEDTSAGPMAARWRHGDAVVDVTPTDRSVLGFSNTWYAPAVAQAQRIIIAGLPARMVTPPYLIASKLEAFHVRGHADVVASSDLEDVVLIVDGRPELLAEIERAAEPVRGFIASEFGALLDDRRFLDSLAGFLPQDRASQARRPLLEKRLRAIAALEAP